MRDFAITRTGGGPKPLPVFPWYCGRDGAASGFTLELAQELRRRDDLGVEVCVTEGSQIAADALSKPGLRLHGVRTVRGSKARLAGRQSSVAGLLRIAFDFAALLEVRPETLVPRTFRSIRDTAGIPTLALLPGRFRPVLHDALFHPGDTYPFRRAACL